MILILGVLSLALSIVKVQAQCTNGAYTFPKDQDIFTVDYNTDNLMIEDKSLKLTLDNSGGTRITLTDMIQYGKIDARMKIAPGSNVVSSFILMAKNGDEIDFEFVGKDTNTMQTNYYYRGIPLYDKNAKYFKTSKNLSTTWNTYTINWTPEYYEWLYNGLSLRKLLKNSTEKYPDSPSQIQFGIWQAPPSKWAGSGLNWAHKSYNFSIDSITITCNKKLNTQTTRTPPRTQTTQQSMPSTTKARSVSIPTTETTTESTSTATTESTSASLTNFMLRYNLYIVIFFFLHI
jgi:beta-glucanase (GH16 family)